MQAPDRTAKVNFQSNSIRDDFLKQIIDRTINEVLASVSTLLGPGATDAYIIKENQAYYTRDGKEICESLIFDNEVANYIHHILYQAVYNQGQNVGDGSTTLAVMYCYIYKILRENPAYASLMKKNINEARRLWKLAVDEIIRKLEERAQPLTDELLLSMLYTCTQDVDLAGKIYHELRDPILAGAYIIPRKSNINTDFHVTVHNRPVYKVTTHFSIREFPKESEYNVVYFCNGAINIAHSELFAAMSMAAIRDPYHPENENARIFPNIIILGTGMTEATRAAIREYNQFMRNVHLDPKATCNITIMTLDEARVLHTEEFEDLATMISDFPGLSGMNQAITFEAYLYKTFLGESAQKALHIDPIDEFENFEADESLVYQMYLNFNHPFRVIYDDVEGIALDKEIRGYAKKRYDELLTQIKEEKSPVKKVELNRRLRRSFGMFIDLEVGSVLLKDSQRKFELILDAIISTAEAAKDGVVIGNSIIHAADIIHEIAHDSQSPASVLMDACSRTVTLLVKNAEPAVVWNDASLTQVFLDGEHDPKDFNLLNHTNVWPTKDSADQPETLVAKGTGEDGTEYEYQINPVIVESLNSIKAIIENSALPMELAFTRQLNLSGRQGLMGNYVD